MKTFFFGLSEALGDLKKFAVFSLTLTLSRWERGQRASAFRFSEACSANPVASARMRRRTILPLSTGEGEARGFSPASLRLAAVLLCAGGFVSTAQAKLNVVITTPDLAAIAKEVGGDKIEITTLARPTEDPHFVDAKPSFIVKLNKADALIEGGAELEIGWLPALLDQARNDKLAAGAPAHVAC